jgi:trans-aconitate methyltransferase
MQAFTWDPKDYKDNSKAQQQWARELMAKLDLKGSENILDIGCGDGKVTVEIAGLVQEGSVIGVDNSDAMIALATEQYPPEKHKNLSFMPMDASNLEFNNEFDVVFSNAALHWVKNHKPVVEGIYKSLRPGGRILLQMGGQGNANDILSVIDDLKYQEEWQPYFEDFEFPYGFLGTEEYTALLEESGFSIDRVELIPKDMEHKDSEGLKGWIRTTWLPYTERIPAEKRDRFINEVAAIYLDRHPLDVNESIHLAMVRLEVAAKKPL